MQACNDPPLLTEEISFITLTDNRLSITVPDIDVEPPEAEEIGQRHGRRTISLCQNLTGPMPPGQVRERRLKFVKN